jgi:hypothetical protein
MEATSDLSGTAAPPSGRPALEDLGLSLVLGIFDLMADRMEREDSLVSERLKDGYEAKPGSLEPLPPASLAFLSFEGWFPILDSLRTASLTQSPDQTSLDRLCFEKLPESLVSASVRRAIGGLPWRRQRYSYVRVEVAALWWSVEALEEGEAVRVGGGGSPGRARGRSPRGGGERVYRRMEAVSWMRQLSLLSSALLTEQSRGPRAMRQGAGRLGGRR